MADPEIELWLNTADGIAMNPDGMYGLQCKDVADQYAMDIFGTRLGHALGLGNAKVGLTVANKTYFDVIWNDPNQPNLIPQRGDIIVWGGTEPGGLNEFGHIAVVTHADKNGVNVLQQDGFAAPHIFVNGNWYSNKPTHTARLGYWNAGTGMVSGWLRPKANKLKRTIKRTPVQKLAKAVEAALPNGKAYRLDEQYNARNLTRGKDSLSVFGHKRNIKHLDIHWWGTPMGQTYMGIVQWFCFDASVQTSCHEIISDGQVATIIPHADIAWGNGNAKANAEGIVLEVNPRGNAGDWATLVQRIRDIRKLHGRHIPLKKHSDFIATACPGIYSDMKKLESLVSDVAPKVTAQSTVTDVLEDWTNMSQKDFNKLMDNWVGTANGRKGVGAAVWGYLNSKVPTAKGRDAYWHLLNTPGANVARPDNNKDIEAELEKVKILMGALVKMNGIDKIEIDADGEVK